ncbi:MAG: gamma-glutamyl-gamma-aminobutyrate hydrolase family protein [Rhizobiaceae bacterium]|jgi:putative glutamine amidotransferase|nr:gamma-glutamyl-gamma-aminobutyrate hydrolase family protein [Rhizobiaceae bacterium]
MVVEHRSVSRRPLVAVVSDIRTFENYTWHAAPHQYLDAAIRGAGVMPLIVPSFGDALDLDAILDAVHGVLVTGSRSNVHPGLYGVEATVAHEPFDTGRDATSIPLIRAALARGVPLLAICRGIQELNVALGGSLATEIQEQPGRMDHRAPVSDVQAERFAIRHPVHVAEGSCLAAIVGAGPVQVNSVHRQGIDRLANGLQVEAVADDGTVEAVSVVGAKAFAVGVQWHPEYWFASDSPSRRIFEGFGDAVRSHGAGRASRLQAAE